MALDLLDDAGAKNWTHEETAAWINAIFRLTVGGGRRSSLQGYERMTGRREDHQWPDDFIVDISKSFNAPVGQLVEAFVHEHNRELWLEPGTISLQSLKYGRRARFNVHSDRSRLDAQFSARSSETSMVALSHDHIGTREEFEAWRSFWNQRLTRLATLLDANS